MAWTHLIRVRNMLICLVGLISSVFMTTSQADILKVTDLFNVPFYNTNGPSDPWTPVAHSQGRTFLVWVDTNNRPWVTQHYNGVVTTGALDAADYTANPDGHHRFSMGIDKLGYLHIMGDMHYYPGGPDGNAYLPARYQNQNVMYWISNQPYSVAGGFSFAGYNISSTALPGAGFLIGRFFHDKNGELYYSTMARAYDNGQFLQGMGGLGVYHYDVKAHKWDALGGYADAPQAPGTKYYKVLYWENAGIQGGGWFQNYQATLQFDNANRLHLAISGIINIADSGATRLLYAMSPDGGVTWKKANGKVIPGLPLRGVSTAANVADVVYDAPTGTTLPAYAGVVADQNGTPAVFSDVWRRWNGNAWVNDMNPNNNYGNRAFLGPDGKITFLQLDTIYLNRSKSFTQNAEAFNLQSFVPNDNLHFFQSISDLGLTQRGSFFGAGTNDTQNIIYVSQLDFTSYPLPSPWANSDIGNNYNGGSADFVGTQLIQKCAGNGIAGTADSLNFTYQPLTGNGTIIAQVVSQDNLRAWATAGVMMRESLAANASTASIGITYSSGTQAISRNGTGASAVATNVFLTPPAQWVKLVRAGNVFTSYWSLDGNNWTQVNQVTINMAQTIYVGTTVWAFGNYEHYATLANIKVTQP